MSVVPTGKGRRNGAAHLLVVLLVVTTLACGRTEPTAVAKMASFCELSGELNRVPLTPDPASSDAAALRQLYSEPAQQENLDRIGDVAPAEVRSDVEVVTDARREIAESGDVSVLARPETRAALERVQSFEQLQCVPPAAGES